jgi:hypothetical protein
MVAAGVVPVPLYFIFVVPLSVAQDDGSEPQGPHDAQDDARLGEGAGTALRGLQTGLSGLLERLCLEKLSLVGGALAHLFGDLGHLSFLGALGLNL